MNQVSQSYFNRNSPLADFILHPYFIILLRVVVGGVMVFAGWVKLFDMPGLASEINNYRILPEAWINFFAIILPPIELIAGLFLIFGIWMGGALAVTTGLLAVFTIAVQSAIMRGLDIECGCFGTSDAQKVGLQTLIRDVLLLFGTIPIWIAYLSNKRSPVPEQEPDLGSEVEAGARDNT